MAALHKIIRFHMGVLRLLGCGEWETPWRHLSWLYGGWRLLVRSLLFWGFLRCAIEIGGSTSWSLDANMAISVTGLLFHLQCFFLAFHARRLDAQHLPHFTKLFRSDEVGRFYPLVGWAPLVVCWASLAWALLNVAANTVNCFLGMAGGWEPRPRHNLFFVPESRFATCGVLVVSWPLYLLCTGAYVSLCALLASAWRAFRLRLADARRHHSSFADLHHEALAGYRPLTQLTKALNEAVKTYVAVSLAAALPSIVVLLFIALIREDTAPRLRFLLGWWSANATAQILCLCAAAFVNNQSEKFRELYTEAFLAQLEGRQEDQDPDDQAPEDPEGPPDAWSPHDHQATPSLMHRARGFMEVLNNNAWTNAVFCWEFFPINMGIVVTLASVFSTYVVVLVEFAQSHSSQCQDLHRLIRHLNLSDSSQPH